MPKISVIVPVYNTEKYLRRCMESILNQTFNDFEIISMLSVINTLKKTAGYGLFPPIISV